MYKEKFIEYCKGRIEDLGKVEIIEEEDYKKEYNVAYIDSLCGYNDIKIIYDDDTDYLMAVNEKNEIVINTPMETCLGNLFDMTFSKIDREFYENVLLYWEDGCCDEYFE